MIGYIIALVIGGLIVGALGRLLVPGRQAIGCIATCLLGIAGSAVGGFIGRLLFGDTYAPGLIMSVLCAAGLVALVTRGQRRV